MGSQPSDRQLDGLQPDLAKPARNPIWRLLLLALVVRLLIAPFMAHGGDMHTFILWSKHLASVGPAGFFDNDYWCDYLPGYLLTLWPMGEISQLFPAMKGGIGLSAKLPYALHYLFYKLPSIFADLGIGWMIWRLGVHSGKRLLWPAAFYLFNPAVLLNSTIWGQADSYHAFWLMLGLYLLVRRRCLLAGAVLGFATAIKPHGIIILPLAIVYALFSGQGMLRVLGAGVTCALAFLVSWIPFNDWSVFGLFTFIKQRAEATMGQYNVGSINALNFWYLLGKNWVKDDQKLIGALTIVGIARALFIIIYVGILAHFVPRLWGQKKQTEKEGKAAGVVSDDAASDGAAMSGPVWLAAALAYLALYLFITRAHERHSFPFLPFIAAALVFYRGAAVALVWMSILYIVNMALSWRYCLLEHQTVYLCVKPLGQALSVAYILTLPIAWCSPTRAMEWLADAGRRVVIRFGSKHERQDDPPWVQKKWGRVLLAILLFALVMRVFRLNTPPERYFDEVYHAYTAEQWAKGNEDPWRWDTHRPEEDKGCAYEWTHPPTAKLIMQMSIETFGAKPWAWRLPSALLGVVNVGLIFLVTRKLFGQTGIALLAAALAALDTEPLALSRIAMNDTYMLFGMLSAVLAALHGRPVLSAVAIGFALSCKWSALYAFPPLGLIFLIRGIRGGRREAVQVVVAQVCYVLIPPLIYLASYIPFFQAQATVREKVDGRMVKVTRHNSLKDFGELQRQMWVYHTGLKAKHDFSSPAIGWPVGYKPVWLHTHTFKAGEDRPEGWRRDVYVMGNAVIFLAGVVAVCYSAWQLVWWQRLTWAIPLAGFLFFWAPWLASPRIMFLYHFLPALPFEYMMLAGALFMGKGYRDRIRLVLFGAAVAFVSTYPYVTGVALPKFLVWQNWGG